MLHGLRISLLPTPSQQGIEKANVVLILHDRPHRRVHNQRPEDHVAQRPVATLIGKTTRRSLLYSIVITFAAIVFAAITLAAIAFAAITLATITLAASVHLCSCRCIARAGVACEYAMRVHSCCTCTPCGVVSAACVC